MTRMLLSPSTQDKDRDARKGIVTLNLYKEGRCYRLQVTVNNDPAESVLLGEGSINIMVETLAQGFSFTVYDVLVIDSTGKFVGLTDWKEL